MIPTAARLATVKPLSRTFESPAKRVAANFVEWSIYFSTFMGWTLGVSCYEEKFHGPTSH